MGIMVNQTTVTPTKSKYLPVTLLNTNSYNVWIWPSLLAPDIVEVEYYHLVMSHDGNQVQVSFYPVPMPEVQAEIFSCGVASADSSPNFGNLNVSAMKEQGEKPKFGPHPEFGSPRFDFKKELEWLPFPVNFGEVELSQSQQKCFLELV